jgi:hypothetical protein
MMRTEGNAAQLLDDYLMGLDIDKVLASVGIYRENVRSRGFSPSDRVIVETLFSREGPRRIDVTSFGDEVQRHIQFGPPGIEVLVNGTSHEVKVFALTLIIDGLQLRLASEEAVEKRLRAEKAKLYREKGERDEMLLAFRDSMKKKRWATFSAANPEVAAHVDRLTADRERERRYEAMDYADE